MLKARRGLTTDTGMTIVKPASDGSTLLAGSTFGIGQPKRSSQQFE